MGMFGLNNVHYDSHSEYQFNELNESSFVEQVFIELYQKMGANFSNYEFYIFSCFRSKVHPQSLHVYSGKPKILIYLSDEFGTDPSKFLPFYHAIFKPYLDDGMIPVGIFPLQLGYVKGVPVFEPKNVVSRKYNVFFRGHLNNNRIGFFRALSNWRYFIPPINLLHKVAFYKFLMNLGNDFSKFFPDSIILFNSSFKSGYSLEQYGEMLSESKIVLCPKGYEKTECFRHFEAIRAGCIIVSEKLPTTEFYANSPIIEIDNWNLGLKVVKNLLNNPDRMNALQRKTIDWWNEKCSEKATADYISRGLKQVNEMAGKKSKSKI